MDTFTLDTSAPKTGGTVGILFRVDKEDRETLRKASRALNMKMATFIRAVAVQAAQKVLEPKAKKKARK